MAEVGGEPAWDMPLADAFFDPTFIASDGVNGTNHVEQVLLGLSTSRAHEIDVKVTDAVRNFLFGAPGSGGMDLAALNIQRGRDHGLPSYNETRLTYGLSPATSFRDITSDRKVRRKLRQLYGSVDEVDSWVGALAEDHVPGSSVGELTLTAIVEEFSRLRDGDRYFYTGDMELMENAAIESVIDLSSITLSEIIEANTGLDCVPDNVFRVGHGVLNSLFDHLNDLFGRIDGFLGHFGDIEIDGVRGWFETPPQLPSGSDVLNVPEPAAFSLAMIVALGSLMRRRRV